ncbi:helix-turn-helix domain-containing protein [Streptomyces sp. NPDC052036]|uniref:helix-turn-helix domain-containing protein n=1 Tax=unclassified Streptomyces TaxID=2593676 RepID=UPI0034493333
MFWSTARTGGEGCRRVVGQAPLDGRAAGTRVELAQQLLSETTLTIEQIAQRCGFAGPGPSSTAFLRHVGVRPSVYPKI